MDNNQKFILRLGGFIAFLLITAFLFIFGILKEQLFLVAASFLILFGWVVFSNFQFFKKKAYDYLLLNLDQKDVLKVIVEEMLKIPGVLAVEVAFSEGDFTSYQSFSMGTPRAGTFSESFPLNIGDLEIGKVKAYLSKNFSSTSKQELFKFIRLLGLAVVVGEFQSEILRYKKISEQSVKARTGFLANLSHELRGPLSNIMNSAELLQNAQDTTEIKDFAEIILKNAKHLLDLVNDILEFAKVEAGKVEPAFEPVSVPEVLKDVYKIMKNFSVKKNITFNFTEQENLYIEIDKKHLKQILINLISNAIKYTREGGKVDLIYFAKDGRAHIEVRDNGIGISADQLGKIFDPFERTNNTYALSQTGTGLGLALTKKLVELNKGYIEVISEEGVGSVFKVAFKLTSQRPEPQLKPALEVNGREAVILFLSWDKENMLSFSRFLAKKNFLVGFCKNLEEMLTELNSTKVGAVLIGDESLKYLPKNFMALLRSTQYGKTAPIILVTAKAFQFEEEEHLKRGFDYALSLPFELQEAALKIQGLIEKN